MGDQGRSNANDQTRSTAAGAQPVPAAPASVELNELARSLWGLARSHDRLAGAVEQEFKARREDLKEIKAALRENTNEQRDLIARVASIEQSRRDERDGVVVRADVARVERNQTDIRSRAVAVAATVGCLGTLATIVFTLARLAGGTG